MERSRHSQEFVVKEAFSHLRWIKTEPAPADLPIVQEAYNRLLRMCEDGQTIDSIKLLNGRDAKNWEATLWFKNTTRPIVFASIDGDVRPIRY